MLISKNWLQSYFENELPDAQKIADKLLLHSFEVEGLEQSGDDWVIDIDVLPNRAHDCLSHDGIAKEISALFDLEIKQSRYKDISNLPKTDETIDVKIENPEQCYRYIANIVKNINVGESPKWLKDQLLSMGQKSINSLVDATNYIMFDIGQPMHVFDADKVLGGITVRNARSGEKITTLSGEDLELLETDLVIADEEKILALAGVKGGTSAEVTDTTKNIIIESANFNPTTTRITARRVKILTDAGKRYENGISSEKSLEAINSMISLVSDLSSNDNTVYSDINSEYPNPETKFELIFTHKETVNLLGFDIKELEINNILEKLKYEYTFENGEYTVTIPFERLDLRISADIIEEIGRLYGYQSIPNKILDGFDFNPTVNDSFYAQQVLKNYFIENGFTEIMNYTFVKGGDVELYNPLASDKKALRKSLSSQMRNSLDKNSRVADFVNSDQVLNFEIDVVHTADGEHLMCCFGINTLSKKSRKQYGDEQSQIEKYTSEIAELFGLKKLDFNKDGNIVSFDIKQCEQESIRSYADILNNSTYKENTKFAGISIYPYIKRDISFWAKTSDTNVFEKAIHDAGAEYLQKIFLFDEFEKDGKTSYAFSMIFQSFDKTLTDVEVDSDMDKINKAVEKLGGEIR